MVRASVALSGSSGFVGRAVARELLHRNFSVRAIVRRDEFWSMSPTTRRDDTQAYDHTSRDPCMAALDGVDCVIHCAARTHVLHETVPDPLGAYREVNLEGTRRLAEQAAAAGVVRFVFLSTIKVNGEGTSGLQSYSRVVQPSVLTGDERFAPDNSTPDDPYGLSKWEAEQALWEISAKTGIEVVVLRLPLVYGQGVKGNLARLLKLIHLGLPLPFGAVHNNRSLIGLDNLVDLLILCVDHLAAAGHTFLVSDGEDLSTPDLIRHMAAAMGRSARLFSVPVSLLRLGGSILGRRAEIDRLVGSLQIDSSRTRQVLGWSPPVTVQEGIRRMVQDT